MSPGTSPGTSPDASSGTSGRHRLVDLLGMRVRYADGRDGDQVTDVRLVPSSRLRGQLSELVVDGFVVGKQRPGTLFGYDRHPEQGPWVIRAIVRFLHRHTGYLTWDDVDRVDWDARVVHLRVEELRDLTAARD
jgi:hypothetical protein